MWLTIYLVYIGYSVLVIFVDPKVNVTWVYHGKWCNIIRSWKGSSSFSRSVSHTVCETVLETPWNFLRQRLMHSSLQSYGLQITVTSKQLTTKPGAQHSGSTKQQWRKWTFSGSIWSMCGSECNEVVVINGALASGADCFTYLHPGQTGTFWAVVLTHKSVKTLLTN